MPSAALVPVISCNRLSDSDPTSIIFNSSPLSVAASLPPILLPLAPLASICLLRLLHRYAFCASMPLASAPLASICLLRLLRQYASRHVTSLALLHYISRFSVTPRAFPFHLSRPEQKFFLHWRIFYFSCLLRAQLCQSTASYASGLAQMSQDNSDNCCCAMADHMLHTCSSPFCPIGAHIMVAVPF